MLHNQWCAEWEKKASEEAIGRNNMNGNIHEIRTKELAVHATLQRYC